MPRLGFKPTMLLSIAGTRPLAAMSVPSDSGTTPADTAVAEPELGELLGLRDRVLLVAQVDEDSTIVMVADALIGSRDRLRRRQRARAIRGHDRGNRLRLVGPTAKNSGNESSPGTCYRAVDESKSIRRWMQ